jgi:hypothetical protein
MPPGVGVVSVIYGTGLSLLLLAQEQSRLCHPDIGRAIFQQIGHPRP